MKKQTYAYIRVSSREQNEDRQRIAMLEYGVSEGNIFMDKQSRKDFSRPGYIYLTKKLQPEDTLVIKSIDRLGRNYNEILEQWRILTKEKQIRIVVLDMPILDTSEGRDLMGTLISDIVLQLLSYVAETERNFIHQHQAEGIAAAKIRGVKFGRKSKKRPAIYEAVKSKWEKGELSAREAVRQLNVTHSTFLR